ncbi:hypothetical protein ACP70R_009848 [Stipagrostis hirtigluma subsp. patula]
MEDEQEALTSMQEDRLSNLPDDILSSILERLKLHEAARTSILSRRWTHLFGVRSSISIDINDFHRKVRGSEFNREDVAKGNANLVRATKSMLAHNARQRISLLRIRFHLHEESIDIIRCVDNAMNNREVTKLHFLMMHPEILDLNRPLDAMVSFERRLSRFLDAGPRAFGGLHYLYMYSLKLDIHDMTNVLNACKNLEHLCLSLCDYGIQSILQIEHAQLTKLTIGYCTFGKVDLTCLPRLTCLNCQNWMPSLHQCPLSFGYVPQLYKVILSTEGTTMHKTFHLSELLHNAMISYLDLDFECEKIWIQPEAPKLVGPLLQNLQFLFLRRIHEECDLDWIMFLLEAAPLLKRIYIQDQMYSRTAPVLGPRVAHFGAAAPDPAMAAAGRLGGNSSGSGAPLRSGGAAAPDPATAAAGRLRLARGACDSGSGGGSHGGPRRQRGKRVGLGGHGDQRLSGRSGDRRCGQLRAALVERGSARAWGRRAAPAVKKEAGVGLGGRRNRCTDSILFSAAADSTAPGSPLRRRRLDQPKLALPRSKLVRDPGSFGYRRLLPFLNKMAKKGGTNGKGMPSENSIANPKRELPRSYLRLVDESLGGIPRESDPMVSMEPVVVDARGDHETKYGCNNVREETNAAPHDLMCSKQRLNQCLRLRVVHHPSSFSYKRMLPFLMENEEKGTLTHSILLKVLYTSAGGNLLSRNGMLKPILLRDKPVDLALLYLTIDVDDMLVGLLLQDGRLNLPPNKQAQICAFGEWSRGPRASYNMNLRCECDHISAASVWDHKSCAYYKDGFTDQEQLLYQKGSNLLAWKATADLKHYNLWELAIRGYQIDEKFTRCIRRVVEAAVNLERILLLENRPCEHCQFSPSTRFPRTEEERYQIKKQVSEWTSSPITIGLGI